MMTTILSDLGTFTLAAGPGPGLWLGAAAAEEATGWSPRPEGLCRGAVCVPVPGGREAEFVAGGKVNLAAFWDHMEHPSAHSTDGDIWVLGESARARADSLRSLEAPDFTLPDLAGLEHSLSDHRGKKVLLATWASW
jgi:hypothetical protein